MGHDVLKATAYSFAGLCAGITLSTVINPQSILLSSTLGAAGAIVGLLIGALGRKQNY